MLGEWKIQDAQTQLPVYRPIGNF